MINKKNQKWNSLENVRKGSEKGENSEKRGVIEEDKEKKVREKIVKIEKLLEKGNKIIEELRTNVKELKETIKELYPDKSKEYKELKKTISDLRAEIMAKTENEEKKKIEKEQELKKAKDRINEIIEKIDKHLGKDGGVTKDNQVGGVYGGFKKNKEKPLGLKDKKIGKGKGKKIEKKIEKKIKKRTEKGKGKEKKKEGGTKETKDKKIETKKEKEFKKTKDKTKEAIEKINKYLKRGKGAIKDNQVGGVYGGIKKNKEKLLGLKDKKTEKERKLLLDLADSCISQYEEYREEKKTEKKTKKRIEKGAEKKTEKKTKKRIEKEKGGKEGGKTKGLNKIIDEKRLKAIEGTLKNFGIKKLLTKYENVDHDEKNRIKKEIEKKIKGIIDETVEKLSDSQKKEIKEKIKYDDLIFSLIEGEKIQKNGEKLGGEEREWDKTILKILGKEAKIFNFRKNNYEKLGAQKTKKEQFLIKEIKKQSFDVLKNFDKTINSKQKENKYFFQRVEIKKNLNKYFEEEHLKISSNGIENITKIFILEYKNKQKKSALKRNEIKNMGDILKSTGTEIDKETAKNLVEIFSGKSFKELSKKEKEQINGKNDQEKKKKYEKIKGAAEVFGSGCILMVILIALGVLNITGKLK